MCGTSANLHRVLIIYSSYWYATSLATGLIADGSLRLERTPQQPIMFANSHLPGSQQESHQCPPSSPSLSLPDLPSRSARQICHADFISRFVLDNC